MKRVLFALVAACYAIGLVACNTVEGMGRDVQKVGEKMEDAAAKKKEGQ